MTARTLRLVLALVALLGAAASAASTPSLDEQRADYLAALEALRAGQSARARALADKLHDYILHGYLEYELLKDNVTTTPPAELHGFLERNSHAPIADAVRKKWLRHLAARGEWTLFLVEYRPFDDESAAAPSPARGVRHGPIGDPELQCLRLDHLLRVSQQQAELMAEIETLWRTPRRLPPPCDAVFAAWRKAGHMTAEKVWERIRLAMEDRQLTFAGELARYLDPKERIWVSRWIAMYRDPVAELANLHYPVETPVARMIVRHGVVRLAYRDPDEAMRQWEALKAKYQVFGEDDNYVLRHVGILAAQDNRPAALKWLAAVSAEPGDETLQLWRVRAALRAGDWAMARSFVAALSEEQQKSPQWRYWKARILDKTGEPKEAERLYASLARERNYYGFLAADRLRTDYSMQHVSIEVAPTELAAMLARPGIAMAKELYLLGLIAEARRQWSFSTRHMNNRELQVAAVVAREWGWHDRAILTVARSDHQDDLELRFPVLYRDMIESNASEYGIDAGWIYGVVRQESAFVVDARSPVGAVGLMQLMPATGQITGRKLRLNVGSPRALLDVENNLRLGASYLKEMLHRHGDNQVLATAAYNAGPNRVASWLPDERVDAQIWVESIPYNETRDYVKNVLAYSAVYDYRLGVRPTRLSSRMPPVAPVRADAP
jgi:soluble lytic murein transglycosylase